MISLGDLILSWKIKHNSITGITQITTNGEFDVQLINKMMKAIIASVDKNKSNGLIIDHSNAIINISIVETFERPKHFDNMGIPRNAKIALIITDDQREAFKFFETVLVNRGFQIKAFHKIDEAENWLKIKL